MVSSLETRAEEDKICAYYDPEPEAPRCGSDGPTSDRMPRRNSVRHRAERMDVQISTAQSSRENPTAKDHRTSLGSKLIRKGSVRELAETLKDRIPMVQPFHQRSQANPKNFSRSESLPTTLPGEDRHQSMQSKTESSLPQTADSVHEPRLGSASVLQLAELLKERIPMYAPLPGKNAKVLKRTQSATALQPKSSEAVPSLADMIRDKIPHLKPISSDGNPKAMHRSKSDIQARSVRDLALLLKDRIPMHMASKPKNAHMTSSDRGLRRSYSDIPDCASLRIPRPPFKGTPAATKNISTLARTDSVSSIPSSGSVRDIAELLKNRIPMFAPKPAANQAATRHKTLQRSHSDAAQSESGHANKHCNPLQKTPLREDFTALTSQNDLTRCQSVPTSANSGSVKELAEFLIDKILLQVAKPARAVEVPHSNAAIVLTRVQTEVAPRGHSVRNLAEALKDKIPMRIIATKATSVHAKLSTRIDPEIYKPRSESIRADKTPTNLKEKNLARQSGVLARQADSIQGKRCREASNASLTDHVLPESFSVLKMVNDSFSETLQAATEFVEYERLKEGCIGGLLPQKLSAPASCVLSEQVTVIRTSKTNRRVDSGSDAIRVHRGNKKIQSNTAEETVDSRREIEDFAILLVEVLMEASKQECSRSCCCCLALSKLLCRLHATDSDRVVASLIEKGATCDLSFNLDDSEETIIGSAGFIANNVDENAAHADQAQAAEMTAPPVSSAIIEISNDTQSLDMAPPAVPRDDSDERVEGDTHYSNQQLCSNNLSVPDDGDGTDKDSSRSDLCRAPPLLEASSFREHRHDGRPFTTENATTTAVPSSGTKDDDSVHTNEDSDRSDEADYFHYEDGVDSELFDYCSPPILSRRCSDKDETETSPSAAHYECFSRPSTDDDSNSANGSGKKVWEKLLEIIEARIDVPGTWDTAMSADGGSPSSTIGEPRPAKSIYHDVSFLKPKKMNRQPPMSSWFGDDATTITFTMSNVHVNKQGSFNATKSFCKKEPVIGLFPASSSLTYPEATNAKEEFSKVGSSSSSSMNVPRRGDADTSPSSSSSSSSLDHHSLLLLRSGKKGKQRVISEQHSSSRFGHTVAPALTWFGCSNERPT